MSSIIELEGKRALRQAQVEQMQEQGVSYMDVVLTEPNVYTVSVYKYPVCNIPSEQLEMVQSIITNTLVAAGVIAV